METAIFTYGRREVGYAPDLLRILGQDDVKGARAVPQPGFHPGVIPGMEGLLQLGKVELWRGVADPVGCGPAVLADLDPVPE